MYKRVTLLYSSKWYIVVQLYFNKNKFKNLKKRNIKKALKKKNLCQIKYL